MLKECAYCGKEFNGRSSKKYCSSECYWESLKGARLSPKKCPGCNKEFIPDRSLRKFCSKECLLKHRRENRIVKCKVCGKEFKRTYVGNVFCSNKCRGKYYSGNRNSKFNGYLTKDYAGYIRFSANHPKHPRKREHQVVWAENNKPDICEMCGGKMELIHHKDGNKKNNDISNLMGLCTSCHSVLHGGRPKIANPS